MNRLKRLPWGVQWEISRYVNMGFGYDRFTIPKLSAWIGLGKNSTAAPEVTKFVESLRKADKAKRAEEEAAAVTKGKATERMGRDTKNNVLMDDDDDARDPFAPAFARELSAKVRSSVV